MMNKEREMAVLAMQNMGWRAERKTDRKHPRWVFYRPDTGGLWDVVSVPQSGLSMSWVAEIAMQHHDAASLVAEIEAAKERWLRSRFFGIYAHAGNLATQETTP